MPEVVLTGCTPEPLMSYLKALGVFRIVAEQADRDAVGSWRGGVFVLRSRFDTDGLTRFLQQEYQPTPIIGPWGARSGFYPGSSEASAREALNAIVTAAGQSSRLGPFRDIILKVHEVLRKYSFVEKVRDEDKLTLMRVCRNELPDGVLSWLDAVFILTDESRKFPPLLGTGGNEGSGSYVSTFAQTVVSLLIEHKCDSGISTALYGDFGAAIDRLAVGHFNPGAVGGANSSQGFDGGGGLNPWDYLLGVEGCLLFAGSAARRLGSDSAGRAAYPFCVEAVAVGYASESDKEAGGSTRAELWLPIWSQPITLPELSQLLAEGRAQLGRRQARNAVEFALAACTLGVSRGIDSFVRYAFVMRNGLSYFAAPLGHVVVTYHPRARLLEDPALGEWLDRLRLACRDKDKTPGRYQSALRCIDRAMYAFAIRSQTDPTTERLGLLEVLRVLGQAEQILADGISFCESSYIRPLQGLNPRWLDQADDGSAEFRLAAALASIRGANADKPGPFRVHLEPTSITRIGRYEWDRGSTSQVWSRGSLVDNLTTVFCRRQMEAFRAGIVGVPLYGTRAAGTGDVSQFLYADIDEAKMHDLIWGLSTLDWSHIARPDPAEAGPFALPFEFGLLRLLVAPLRFTSRGGRWRWAGDGTDHVTNPDAAIFQALTSDQAETVERAVDLAARRLKASGLLVKGYRNRDRSGRSLCVQSSISPQRLLAAMLFPLSQRDMLRIANTVLHPPETQE